MVLLRAAFNEASFAVLSTTAAVASAVASCNCLAKMLAFALLWTTAVSKSDKINVAIQ